MWRGLAAEGFRPPELAALLGELLTLRSRPSAALPWLPDLALPVVAAELNGVKGRFLIDTGVGETLVDPALVDQAGWSASGKSRSHFPSGPAGAVEHRLIADLALGPLRLTGTTLDDRARLPRRRPNAPVTAGTPFHLAGDQYPLVPARINDRLNAARAPGRHAAAELSAGATLGLSDRRAPRRRLHQPRPAQP